MRVGHFVPASKEAVKSVDVRDWNKGAIELSKRLAGFGPAYSFEAGSQFHFEKTWRRTIEFKNTS